MTWEKPYCNPSSPYLLYITEALNSVSFFRDFAQVIKKSNVCVYLDTKIYLMGTEEVVGKWEEGGGAQGCL